MYVTISVIMAYYHNIVQYVSDAIHSVKGHTFAEWELLVIYDVSAENFVSIVEEFCNVVFLRFLRNEKPIGMPVSLRNIRTDVQNDAYCTRYMPDEFLNMDTTQLNDLGWKAKVPLDEMFRRLVGWMREIQKK